MSDSSSWSVKVYIYDISKGMARSLSQAFLGKHIEGVWHTGIVVYGKEYFFGGDTGITSCHPGGTILGQPDTIVELGQTQIPKDVFMGYLDGLAQSTFKPSCYHLLENNCNNFSSEIAQFLTGNDIPSHITGLPAEVFSTPLGQMIKPLVDAMYVNPSGGQALFPTDSTSIPPSVPPTNTFITDVPSQSGASKGASKSISDAEDIKGATSQSPSGSQESASSGEFNVECEEEFPEMEPIVYKEQIPSQKPFLDDLSDRIPKKDLSLVSNLYEYLNEENPSWSLCPDHVRVLHTVIGDGRMGDHLRGQICVIVQDLVLREEFVEVLENEPTKFMCNLIEHCEQVTENVQISILKVLTNCCSHDIGHKFITKDNSKEPNMLTITCKLCVSALLRENSEVYEKASALVYNLSRFKMTEDSQVEIGSAILECLQKDLSEPIAYNLLMCLIHLMRENAEMCDLAGVVGMNCSTHQKLSHRVRKLCEEAQILTAL